MFRVSLVEQSGDFTHLVNEELQIVQLLWSNIQGRFPGGEAFEQITQHVQFIQVFAPNLADEGTGALDVFHEAF